MIRRLVGDVMACSAAEAVILCSGVGYGVRLTVDDLASLNANPKNADIYIYTHAKESGWDLYGFLNEKHRQLFEAVIKVNGIGPKSALQILSCFSPSELVNIIRMGETKKLTKVPGVGGKTAARLLLEMKDKVDSGLLGAEADADNQGRASRDETMEALLALGYKEKQIDKVLPELDRLAAEGVEGPALVKVALRLL